MPGRDSAECAFVAWDVLQPYQFACIPPYANSGRRRVAQLSLGSSLSRRRRVQASSVAAIPLTRPGELTPPDRINHPTIASHTCQRKRHASKPSHFLDFAGSDPGTPPVGVLQITLGGRGGLSTADKESTPGTSAAPEGFSRADLDALIAVAPVVAALLDTAVRARALKVWERRKHRCSCSQHWPTPHPCV